MTWKRRSFIILVFLMKCFLKCSLIRIPLFPTFIPFWANKQVFRVFFFTELLSFSSEHNFAHSNCFAPDLILDVSPLYSVLKTYRTKSVPLDLKLFFMYCNNLLVIERNFRSRTSRPAVKSSELHSQQKFYVKN